MASISAPTPHKLSFTNSHKFLHVKRPSYPRPSFPPFPDSPTLCRCFASSSENNNSINRRWELVIQDVFKNAVKLFDSYLKDAAAKNNNKNKVGVPNDGVSENCESGEDEWNWDMWKRHFDEVDDQERLASILKRAVVEERYEDAALLRDKAGAGLVGWWAGISEDKKDPYGIVIHVTAEHGKYVATSYTPRQLATAAAGVPLFEIFLTVNKKGEYKQQAVYLKREGILEDSSTVSSKVSGATSRLNPPGTTEDKDDHVVSTEDGDDSDDSSDLAEGLTGFQNILRDMIPGIRVKVLKVCAPGKVDRDFISKVIEQIMKEEDEEKDAEVENVESEDEDKDESNQERNEVEMDAGSGITEIEKEQTEILVKVVVGGLVQKLPANVSANEFLRVPAKIEKKGRLSFSFSMEKDSKRQESGVKDLS